MKTKTKKIKRIIDTFLMWKLEFRRLLNGGLLKEVDWEILLYLRNPNL